jgi:hypothetical protein
MKAVSAIGKDMFRTTFHRALFSSAAQVQLLEPPQTSGLDMIREIKSFVPCLRTHDFQAVAFELIGMKIAFLMGPHPPRRLRETRSCQGFCDSGVKR